VAFSFRVNVRLDPTDLAGFDDYSVVGGVSRPSPAFGLDVSVHQAGYRQGGHLTAACGGQSLAAGAGERNSYLAGISPDLPALFDAWQAQISAGASQNADLIISYTNRADEPGLQGLLSAIFTGRCST
jgi:hypothetical protein